LGRRKRNLPLARCKRATSHPSPFATGRRAPRVNWIRD